MFQQCIVQLTNIMRPIAEEDRKNMHSRPLSHVLLTTSSLLAPRRDPFFKYGEMDG